MDDLWLERELARQLAPVSAPDSLWDRINRQQINPRQRTPSPASLDWAFWPVAVAMMLLAFAAVLRTSGARYDPDQLTSRELAALAHRNPAGFDFKSDSFDDMRAWLKAEANIDIDLPSGSTRNPRAVQLLGARLIRVHGLPIAAIDYLVGDEQATLFVSGKQGRQSGNTEASKHLFSRVESTGNVRAVSWNMRNQTYTIAFAGSKTPRGACVLCHVNTATAVF